MKKMFILFLLCFVMKGLSAQENSTPAIFPGGEEAWNHYLDTSFHNQNMAKQMTKKDFDRFGKTQKLSYYFSIMTDGSIGLVTIEGSASQAVRNELQRVLRESPKWTPATLNGKPSIYRKKQSSTFIFE